MHTSFLVIQDGLQRITPFFWLNPCQVLLSFRAVQVKQLAFLANFLSDLFRRLATLSCRLQGLDFAAISGVQHGKGGKNGKSQWIYSGQTNVGSDFLDILHLWIFPIREWQMRSKTTQFQNSTNSLPFFHCHVWWSEAISMWIFLFGLSVFSALLRMASTSRSTIIAASGHGDGDGSGSNFYHSLH